jgi:protein ImuB
LWRVRKRWGYRLTKRFSRRHYAIELLHLTDTQTQQLATLGVKTLGELSALPDAGRRRRWGQALGLQLAELYGSRPESRPSFVAPEQYRAQVDFLDATHDHALLMPVLDALWAGLQAYLNARALAANRHALVFQHGRSLPPTQIVIATRQPGRDPQRWRRIAEEWMGRTPWPDGVYGLAIQDVETVVYAPQSDELFPGQATVTSHFEDLIERLLARLGEGSLRRLEVLDDHRPERAIRESDLKGASAAPLAMRAVHGLRPTWLLPVPRALIERQGGMPEWQGVLTFLAGPERLETGWWDGAPMRRDYFVVRNRQGEVGWIFRDLTRGGWYLHGFFS